jgi:hypothetical protein
MSRVGLVVAAIAAVVGVALAGCSAMPSMPDWMPGWMSSNPPAAQLQAVRFESDPPGADVRTAQGQSCLTPCSLSVPSETQAVSITKIGFIAQTVQLSASEPPPHAFWENPPPSLMPNPLQVVLQAVPPPPRQIRKRKPHGSVSRTTTPARTRTAAKTMSPDGGASNVFPDPPAEQPDPAGASPFPPPPGQ